MTLWFHELKEACYDESFQRIFNLFTYVEHIDKH